MTLSYLIIVTTYHFPPLHTVLFSNLSPFNILLGDGGVGSVIEGSGSSGGEGVFKLAGSLRT